MEYEKIKYSEIDYIAVKHLLMYGDKVKAYIFSRAGQTNSTNKQSIKNMAYRYFKQDHINVLYNIEVQSFESSLNSMLDRLGLKKPTSDFKPKEDKQTPLKGNKLTRDDLIDLIARKLTGNPDDATVKTLSPLIAKLESWDTQKPQDNSNIVIYELPSKVN